MKEGGVTLEEVRRALRMPLPGFRAQQRMSTTPRITPEELERSAPPREGAVLILLYPLNGQLHLPLTRRTTHVAEHKGEISLLGGAREPGDASFWQTALREAHEEVAIDPQEVQFLGALSPLYIPSSNFDIRPFVGYIPSRPAFAPDEREVAELIEMPLQTLLDPSAKAEETRVYKGRQVRVPFYRFQHHVIWGATAMVLSELEVLLAQALTLPTEERPQVR